MACSHSLFSFFLICFLFLSCFILISSVLCTAPCKAGGGENMCLTSSETDEAVNLWIHFGINVTQIDLNRRHTHHNWSWSFIIPSVRLLWSVMPCGKRSSVYISAPLKHQMEFQIMNDLTRFPKHWKPPHPQQLKKNGTKRRQHCWQCYTSIRIQFLWSHWHTNSHIHDNLTSPKKQWTVS